jgi:site-specific DNA-methyltransferase (adenine-specific)
MRNHPTTNNSIPRAPRNRTLRLSPNEKARYASRLVKLCAPAQLHDIANKTIHQGLLTMLAWLPESFVDLLFIDPPYNLTKEFNETTFREQPTDVYTAWFESWFPQLIRTLKRTASVYICGDWRTAATIQRVAEKYLVVLNRITWEREKGRGAKQKLEEQRRGYLVLHRVR